MVSGQINACSELPTTDCLAEIAYGSLMETETQTLVAEMRNYSTHEKRGEIIDKAAEVGRLVNGLSNSLGRKARTDR